MKDFNRSDPKKKFDQAYMRAMTENLNSRPKQPVSGDVKPIKKNKPISSKTLYQDGNNWNINNEVNDMDYHNQRAYELQNILFNSRMIDLLQKPGVDVWRNRRSK